MVLLDFDGTVIDLWPRYWSVFKDILSIDVPLAQYKQVKQQYKKDFLVAAHFGVTLPKDYFDRKRVLLEEPTYLELDSLLLDLEKLNLILKGNVAFFTKRRNRTNFITQLKKIGIVGHEIVIEDGSKKDWIENNCRSSDSITVIGDSLEDLTTACLDKVKVWMVGYGLYTKVDFDNENISYNYIATPTELQEKLLKEIEQDAIQGFTKTV